MRVCFTNLGCKLNQAEIEAMARDFAAAGHRVVASPAEADLHVVNSCTVTAAAARASRKAARRAGRGSLTVLSGCWATERPEEAARTAGVDLVVGNADKDRLLERVHAAFPAAVPAAIPPSGAEPALFAQRDLGRTLVYVTHDQVEAMSMPDRVAVLREGVVQQVDTPEAVYHRPVNRFVATVVGSPPMNFIPCTVGARNGGLLLKHALFEVELQAKGLALGESLAEGKDCLLGVRPEDVRVEATGDDAFDATVYTSEPLGGETVVDLQVGHTLVKALAPPSVGVVQDATVKIALDPARLHLFTDEGEAVLSAAGEPIFSIRPTA